MIILLIPSVKTKKVRCTLKTILLIYEIIVLFSSIIARPVASFDK